MLAEALPEAYEHPVAILLFAIAVFVLAKWLGGNRGGGNY